MSCIHEDPPPRIKGLYDECREQRNQNVVDYHKCTSFKPLNFDAYPDPIYQFPNKYLEQLSKFDGSDVVGALDHVHSFAYEITLMFYKELLVYHIEDIIMMFFALTLEGNAQNWYSELHLERIFNFEQFKDIFMKQWTNRQVEKGGSSNVQENEGKEALFLDHQDEINNKCNKEEESQEKPFLPNSHESSDEDVDGKCTFGRGG